MSIANWVKNHANVILSKRYPSIDDEMVQGFKVLSGIIYGNSENRSVAEADTKKQIRNVKVIANQILNKVLSDKNDEINKYLTPDAIKDLNEIDTCYICGESIENFNNEIEHILPFAFAIQFNAIIGKSFSSKFVFNEKDMSLYSEKDDDGTRIIYNFLQLMLLCLEVRNSHQCCNQAKENMLFIQLDNNKLDNNKWSLHKERLKLYLDRLYDGRAYSHIGDVQNKGCSKEFITLLHKKYKTKKDFIDKRSTYLINNYFQPMCNIMNKMENNSINGESWKSKAGFDYLVRFGNADSFVDDPTAYRLLTGKDIDKPILEPDTLYASIFMRLKKGFENKDVLNKFVLEITNIISRSEPELVQQSEKFKNAIIRQSARGSNPNIKNMVNHYIRENQLTNAIRVYVFLFLQSRPTYTDQDYMNDTLFHTVYPEIQKLFLYLLTNKENVTITNDDNEKVIIYPNGISAEITFNDIQNSLENSPSKTIYSEELDKFIQKFNKIKNNENANLLVDLSESVKEELGTYLSSTKEEKEAEIYVDEVWSKGIQNAKRKIQAAESKLYSHDDNDAPPESKRQTIWSNYNGGNKRTKNTKKRRSVRVKKSPKKMTKKRRKVRKGKKM